MEREEEGYFCNINGRVIPMRFYIDNDRDILQSLAGQFHMGVESFHLHNPSIVNPDQIVRGIQV